MANNQVVTPYDDAGFPGNAVRTTPIALGGTVVVKASPGRLLKLAVTTAVGSGGPVTVYDNASGAASGTVLAVIPASTSPGTPVDVNLPAASGITVVSSATTGAITVGYS